MRANIKSPFLIAMAAVLLCVLTDSTQLFSHGYWNVWYKNVEHHTAGSAAMVSLDDGLAASAHSIASSTAKQAETVDILLKAGAKRVFLDSPGNYGSDQDGDRLLQATLAANANHVTVVRRAHVVMDAAAPAHSALTAASFPVAPTVSVLASAWNVDFMGYVLNADTVIRSTNGSLPSVPAAAAESAQQQRIYPDFRLAPSSVTVISAKELLTNIELATNLRGRDVFVTSTNPGLPSAVGFFGYSGNVPAAIADIASMDVRAAKDPLEAGELPMLILVLSLVAVGNRVRRRRLKFVVYGVAVTAALVLPGIIRDLGVIMQPSAAMIALMAYGPMRGSQKWRNQVKQTSGSSGLPNIEAMVAGGVAKSQDVVAASISQYEQMLASLPKELHGECARQIARRIALGAGDRQVFDTDNGHFLWLENSQLLDSIVEHLEGLRALFSSPLVIGGHVLDTTIHFGLDRNSDSRPITRVQSALAAANEAQGKGKLYEEFGHQRLAQSPWELSLHARIDEGLRNGDIWLALQPQLDLRDGRISGAEALIRWNDPERGVIPPDAFILQAERAGRIETITYWVLERSIGMVNSLNRLSSPFQISVNLSARMVDHPALISRVSDIVRANPVDCNLITFEVTETFSLANREQAKLNLSALRAMGFRLSIDDFGTGQASLAYLAEIPSDEIKLDRRFVQAITTDPRERCIVDSVIKLAHALGQEVVAEGIEDEATLQELHRLGCDLAQGYYIGRPVKYSDFSDLLSSSQINTGTG
jgi:EAL domain-containing protein (putative c-di-GMP-specific phosphodiesterase class I)